MSEDVLKYWSEFYKTQIDAMKRFDNPITFTCKVSHKCLKAYCDAMHGIKVEKVSLATLLELIKFLMDLGKSEFFMRVDSNIKILRRLLL